MKKEGQPFGVNACSLCEQIALTFGEQKWGGIRYCEPCLHETLSWLQLDEAGQENITKLFAAVRKIPTVEKQLAKYSKVSAETLHSVSIGESRARMMQAAIEEAGRE